MDLTALKSLIVRLRVIQPKNKSDLCKLRPINCRLEIYSARLNIKCWRLDSSGITMLCDLQWLELGCPLTGRHLRLHIKRLDDYVTSSSVYQKRRIYHMTIFQKMHINRWKYIIVFNCISDEMEPWRLIETEKQDMTFLAEMKSYAVLSNFIKTDYSSFYWKCFWSKFSLK